jgi:hypothetical protein
MTETHEHGDCPVCGRTDVDLTRKPPIRNDQPERLACTDERACFRSWQALKPR